jgi:serine/threonine protein kinase
MLMKRLDHEDGAPVWSCRAGTELVDGFLAWQRLAVGSYCETWLVWSGWMWCPAVLRLTRPHRVEHPRGTSPLAREVAALNGNHHPALPRLYRDGSTARVPYLALEYVEGPRLDEELTVDVPLEEPEAALLGAHLLTGLLALHRRGIAHLGLTPKAVVLRDMRPVLIDFSAARRIGPRPRAGRSAGAPGYGAPELEYGEPVAATMDLYSLGAVLHEALCGEPAFDPATPARERPLPRPLGQSRLAELVTALLDPDPGKRPLAAEALTTFARTMPHDLRPWPVWADTCA